MSRLSYSEKRDGMDSDVSKLAESSLGEEDTTQIGRSGIFFFVPWWWSVLAHFEAQPYNTQLLFSYSR